MPSVRFNCPHCKLGLNVPEQRSGTDVRCPRCKETVKVPLASEPLEHPAPPAPPRIQPPPSAPVKLEPVTEAPAIEPSSLSASSPVSPPVLEPGVRDEQRSEHENESTRQRVDNLGRQHRINLPRSAIYIQGGLLAAVGLAGLFLGLLIGWNTSDNGMVVATQKSATVRGRVTYAEGRFDTPDPGAVVMVLPRGTFPSERIPIESLKPGIAPFDKDDPTVQEIRRMGGDVARTKENGQFLLRVSAGGSFYLLAISQNRPSDRAIQPKDLDEISNYFRGTSDLIGQQSYRWTRETLKDTRTISILFP